MLMHFCFSLMLFTTDRSVGNRVKLVELHQMVREDPAM